MPVGTPELYSLMSSEYSKAFMVLKQEPSVSKGVLLTSLSRSPTF